MASSEKIIFSEDDILRFIPQRPPMVMVDKLISAEDKKTVTTFKIEATNIFCERGFFREPGLIENIAQTAAAGAGYRSMHNNIEPPPGFIGGIKNLSIYAFPSVGDEIRTEVIIEYEVFDATVVSGKIYHGTNLFAECEMKIFLIK